MGGCAKKPEGLPEVRLGYFPNITHAQAFVGVARGDFEQSLAGKANLRTYIFNAGPAVIEAVYAGQIDIAYIGPAPAINGFLKSKGQEIRVVAGAMNNGVLIVANTKRDIRKLEDLSGKIIATPQRGNTQDIAAQYYISKTLGLPLKEQGGETEVIPVANPDVEILLEKDQLDAAWVPEPWASRLIDRGLVVRIAGEEELWPTGQFNLTNIIVSRKFLESHPDLIEQILAAHVMITREFQADRQKLAGLLNQHMKTLTGKTLPEAVMAAALDNLEFTIRPDRVTFERNFEMARELGFIKDDSLDMDTLFDTKILDKLATQP